MASVFNRLDTLNQTFRTGLVLAITAGVGYGGYFGYNRFVKPAIELEGMREERDKLANELEQTREVVGRQKQQIGHLEKENDRLATSLRLIKVDRRLAYLTITQLQEKTEDKPASMTVLYTEVDENGNRIDTPRIFHLTGNLLSVDCWLVKFYDKYIESADIARGSSLCIIRGIKGDPDATLQMIDQGIPFNADNDPNTDLRPPAYRTAGNMSDLEKKIWSDFWSVANDTEQQEAMGIRANHGQVNYIQVKKVGAVYELDLRASDGGTIRLLENPPAVALPKSGT